MWSGSGGTGDLYDPRAGRATAAGCPARGPAGGSTLAVSLFFPERFCSLFVHAYSFFSNLKGQDAIFLYYSMLDPRRSGEICVELPPKRDARPLLLEKNAARNTRHRHKLLKLPHGGSHGHTEVGHSRRQP